MCRQTWKLLHDLECQKGVRIVDTMNENPMQKTSAIEKQLGELASTLGQPVVKHESVSVTVNIEKTGVSHLLKHLAAQIDLRLQKAPPKEELLSKLEQYFTGLLYIRVAYVNSNTRRPSGNVPKSKDLQIPAILDPFVAAIGRVDSLDTAISLLPVMEEPTSEGDFWKEWNSIRFELESLFVAARVHMSTAMPKSVQGDIDVMAFQIESSSFGGSEDRVLTHHSVVSNAKALLACIYSFSRINAVFSPYRVTYGSVVQYHEHVSNLARSAFVE